MSEGDNAIAGYDLKFHLTKVHLRLTTQTILSDAINIQIKQVWTNSAGQAAKLQYRIAFPNAHHTITNMPHWSGRGL